MAGYLRNGTGRHVWNIMVLYVMIQTSRILAEDKECPDGCQCIQRDIGTFTGCISTNLTSIPKNIPEDTDELYLKEHSIEVLHQESFAGLPELKTLVLFNCGIRSIEPNAFAGLGVLGSLDLGGNDIKELASYTFSGLFHLKRLELDDNKLEVVHNFAFHGLNLTKLSIQRNEHLSEFAHKAFYGARIHDLWIFNASVKSKALHSLRPLASSLKELHWQNNQKPMHIPENLFQGFTFRNLDLKYNGIKNISFLKHTAADDLSLEGNPTGSVMFSRYPNLRRVRNLRLGDTGFSKIDGGYFAGLINLKQLYLSNNDIRFLPLSLQATFDALERLVIEGNPLHCNCEMLWFREWLYITDVNVIGAECATPELYDVILASEDIFQCTAPAVLDITRNVNISSSSRFHLKCSAFGDPSPKILWETPSGVSLPGESHHGHHNSTVNTATLTVQSGQVTDAGQYKCLAINVEGNASAFANVDIYTVLGASSTVAPAFQVACQFVTFFVWFIVTHL